MIQTALDKFRDEKGQGLTEYGLILILVAAAVVGGLTGFGRELANFFDWILNALPF
jgi:Flp pilus assembly pilin Flp